MVFHPPCAEQELKGYEDGQREVMKAVAATAESNLADCAVIAAPEVMYDERKKNLDEFINEAGNHVTDACCAYLLPLIQGEVNARFEDGLPVHLILK